MANAKRVLVATAAARVGESFVGNGARRQLRRSAVLDRGVNASVVEKLRNVGAKRVTPLLAQYPYNSFHDWHFEILFVVAIIIQLIHILVEAL